MLSEWPLLSHADVGHAGAHPGGAHHRDYAGLVLDRPGVPVLDPRTAALVRVGVLAAIGAPEVCLEWSSSQALAAGATEDEITGVLLAIAPVIGLGRMAGAAPGVAGAFGYDIEAALDDPDEP